MNLFDQHSHSQKSFDGQVKHGDTLSKRPHSQMQLFFLLRLMRLLDLRQNRGESPGEWQSKLLDRTIYSTFVDCLEQGVGDDARNLLHQREAAKQS